MVRTGLSVDSDVAVTASWKRCERQYGLMRDATSPIMRIQSSEIRSRLEETTERIGGRHGIFRHLSGIAARTGQCLVLTDTNGILVRLAAKSVTDNNEGWHGITLGSRWEERIAGTNGVSMAMQEGKAFTVRGQDHFYSRLGHFACTAVPLLDADNQAVGFLNLAMIDNDYPADYLFARQLLQNAADRIQRMLFERHFSDSMLVSLSPRKPTELLERNELVAVDEAGIIRGTTSRLHQFVGMDTPDHLKGQAFEAVFGVDAAGFEKIPERILSLSTSTGRSVNAKTHVPGKALNRAARPRPRITHRFSSLRDIAIGSYAMAELCKKAKAYFDQGMPMLVEGETGTGKSHLISALHHADRGEIDNLITVDCATLNEDSGARKQVARLLEQVRILATIHEGDGRKPTLVFDNVDELPDFAQVALRALLNDLETECAPGGENHMPAMVATCQHSLADAMRSGAFRDDLYYLLASAHVALPPLRSRERPDALAQSLAARVAGNRVTFTKEALEAIASHPWPGNVRELRNVLERALLAGNGDRISLLDLDLAIEPPHRASSLPPMKRKKADRYDERTMLLDALVGAGWNVTRAARVLGIGRATIHRKMKLHAIARPH